MQKIAPINAAEEDRMSLGTIAVTGLVIAVVLIVAAITLINKYAN